MLQLGVLTGINLDKKLLHQLVRQKCDICIRAKATDSAHTGSLPVPDKAWRRFSTDLSAKFNTMSIHGNYYQMAIIDRCQDEVLLGLLPRDEGSSLREDSGVAREGDQTTSG
jgi:hypothetical protein